jgi:molecular chaperone GrpE
MPKSTDPNQSADSGDGEAGLPIEVEVVPPDPTPEERVAELDARNKETYDKYVRSVAELDNVRKRGRKDVEDARFDAQTRVLREMLPVIDNLERALAHATAAGDSSGVMEGVRLVLRQFAQALERQNVHAVEARGKAFDPTEHEAVSQAETADAAPGTVIEVLQTGYRIGDRLLRPALVVVAKAPSDPRPGTSGSNGHDPDAA